jgi:hypothetical protein
VLIEEGEANQSQISCEWIYITKQNHDKLAYNTIEIEASDIPGNVSILEHKMSV